MPKCGFSNSPSFKFCAECGEKLRFPEKILPKDLSFEEKLAKIQRYLPKGVTEKVLSQRDRIEGEQKNVTVMFCDMEGFTAFSDKLSPEDAYSLMDQVYEILIHKVHDYGGTVNEMTGDGIMALFWGTHRLGRRTSAGDLVRHLDSPGNGPVQRKDQTGKAD